MKRIYLLMIFGLMSMALTYGICVQIKTVSNNGSTVSLTDEQKKLKSEILKTSEKYQNLYNEQEKMEKQLEEVRESSAKNNTTLEDLELTIKEKSLLLGLTEVTGTGVKITVNDNNILPNNYLGNVSDLLVHDGDLIHIVNELFNSGAEAVSINDQRVISSTAIECDGNVVKVNGTKLGAPFEILAVGYPEHLAGISRPGGYLELLETRGVIVNLSKQSTVKIPKYSGTIKFNYASNIE